MDSHFTPTLCDALRPYLDIPKMQAEIEQDLCRRIREATEQYHKDYPEDSHTYTTKFDWNLSLEWTITTADCHCPECEQLALPESQ